MVGQKLGKKRISLNKQDLLKVTVGILLALLAIGCDSENETNPIFTAPSGLVLTISTSPTTLNKGAQSTVTVTARQDGVLKKGVAVTLSTTNTQAVLTKNSVTTDSSGTVATTVSVGKSFEGTSFDVLATSSGVTAIATVVVRPLITFQITVSPEPLRRGTTSLATVQVLEDGEIPETADVSVNVTEGSLLDFDDLTTSVQGIDFTGATNGNVTFLISVASGETAISTVLSVSSGDATESKTIGIGD